MMLDVDIIARNVCFTGHRPEKLNVLEQDVIKSLEAAIELAIISGYKTFITGMARGVDIWAAEIIIKKKRDSIDINLICALPYEGFEKSWSSDWQKRYRDILERADLVKVISPCYSKACFQKRNEWMVDHSSRVIAVWNGEPSGTKNTMVYAEKVGVLVISCYPK